ncbi:transposase, partial [Paracraurococcus lichenis]
KMWLLPFVAMFIRPSWLNAVALATGALLCVNRRTVCAALRAVDGSTHKGFSRFHRFLSRAEWSGLRGARILLGLLQKAFVPEGEPLVIAADDSVERRRGAKIRDKGIWRDAVRSSRGGVVQNRPVSGNAGARREPACEGRTSTCDVMCGRRSASPRQARRG